LYICLTLDLARQVLRGSHPRAFIASIVSLYLCLYSIVRGKNGNWYWPIFGLGKWHMGHWDWKR
jgi:hypothetical protein